MIVAFTGAGISKPSGIKTFDELMDVRDDKGLNIRDKLYRSYFQHHPQDFYDTCMIMKEAINKAEPNLAHIALAEAGAQIITMNIDQLHQKAGSKNVLELHGSMDIVKCPRCHKTYPFDVVKTDIHCCKKVLQHNIILYEDSAPAYKKAFDIVEKMTKHDTFIIVGTSFYTSISNDLRNMAFYSGARIIEENTDCITNIPKILKKVLS